MLFDKKNMPESLAGTFPMLDLGGRGSLSQLAEQTEGDSRSSARIAEAAAEIWTCLVGSALPGSDQNGVKGDVILGRP
ncbi:hypothetical protein NQZ68_027245 [Dissostichus eleginoides]|nr:hypothetical protein NQZ68_027245 [Dissostichus eleginoides]